MNVIVMVDENWAIGKDSDQLVYIAPDLKRFQALTKGHAILLGRKTLDTFPGGKPLKNRRNLILSTREGYEVENAEVFRSIEDVLAVAPKDTFVVGGASVYLQMLPFCDKAYITKVQGAYPADCHFPNLDEDARWRVVEEEGPFLHEDLRFSYVTYQRV
ncbi:MAG: Dihydrofolate reductase [Evtepia sp.]|jgi:dihydrofolate reductase|nr:Dihydrofolate reductase [Evtepia sp.]